MRVTAALGGSSLFDQHWPFAVLLFLNRKTENPKKRGFVCTLVDLSTSK
jgi:hypothetical protein